MTYQKTLYIFIAKKTAISKENVLPNAMVRDVLIANPQSAKSNNVVNAINGRIDPMPDYMMAEIMQGENIWGAKELLEQELAKHRTKKGKSFNKLLQYYTSDILNTANSNDSIVSVLENDIRHSSHYKLALWYMKCNDSAPAFSTLADIPVDFDLNTKEQNIHSIYEDLLEIQWGITCDSNEIDSLRIQSLLDISNNNYLPGIMARNILIHEEAIVYNEPVYLPDLNKSLPVAYNFKEPIIENNILKLFPNPAGTYFIAEYDIRGYDGNALLNVTDLHGKVITSFAINDKQNQKTISRESIPSGIYLVRIMINSKIIAAEKLILSR